MPRLVKGSAAKDPQAPCSAGNATFGALGSSNRNVHACREMSGTPRRLHLHWYWLSSAHRPPLSHPILRVMHFSRCTSALCALLIFAAARSLSSQSSVGAAARAPGPAGEIRGRLVEQGSERV